MMNNLVVFPLFIPIFCAIILFIFPKQLRLQHLLSMIGAVGSVIVSAVLIAQVNRDGIQVLHLGGWQAPYGISLVADMLAVLLATAASIVTLAAVLYTKHTTTDEMKRHYIYPLMLLLLGGVNGTFLTGDIFNLFVFFEVMLLASYVLLSLGGGRVQLRETIKYIIINTIASSLFVIAISYLYSITGTLNMAHLAERVALAGQDGLLTTVSLLFLVVFGLKSALLLFFWLPGSYKAAPLPVLVMFGALLTKVGVYTLLRTFTLIFPHQPQVTHMTMLIMAAITMVLGALGAIAYSSIRSILVYNIIVSIGFILFGIAIATPESLTGSLFYLLHDMFAKALVFILGGTIISITGTDKLKEINGLIRFKPWLGWLFLVAGLAIAGVPPLSGFVGKVTILQSGIANEQYMMIFISIATSFLVMYSMMKIFINSFWGETLFSQGEEKASGKGALLPAVMLTALVVGMGVFAEAVLPFIDQAAQVMTNPQLYIERVLYNR
ncbi:Na+/H+ antiporter subunit D [Paenibacillus yanchengensis]|uniref:Na+/H+ antiporter subunit D n=1 Tax=Paenibacillus yanchengensis TaxID=2035833 RepID=A0ABW4YGB0_9BACL